MIRRLLLLALTVVGAVVLTASPAAAHNSLDGSVPADGATVTEQPGSVLWRFTKDVPLETLTVTLTDPTGVRTELPGSTHGATANEVVTPLPQLADGAYGLRWRLVSADGHAITGRVEFTVTLAAAVPTTAVAPSAGTPTTVASVAAAPADVVPTSTPSWLRWGLRYGSYLAVMVIAGVTVAESFLWRRPAGPRMRSMVSRALAGVAVLAMLQLLVLAGDIAGEPMWSAWGSVGVAAETAAGVALVVRIALAVAAWLLLTHARPVDPLIHSQTVVLLSLGMLATWSFSGHARTVRWPWVGVPIDVAHHGAAAAWIGGLAVIGAATFRGRGDAGLLEMLRRFSTVAAWAVGIIVATGLVQSLRLGGGPASLFTTSHGRLLLVKLALLAVMLWFADRNRRRVRSHVRADELTPLQLAGLRSMVRRELLVGLAIIGVTASLVVQPPAAVQADGPAPALAQ